MIGTCEVEGSYAQRAAERHPVDPRHPEVQDDGGRGRGTQALERGLTLRVRDGCVAGPQKHVADDLAAHRVVVDDRDPFHGGGTPRVPCYRRRSARRRDRSRRDARKRRAARGIAHDGFSFRASNIQALAGSPSGDHTLERARSSRFAGGRQSSRSSARSPVPLVEALRVRSIVGDRNRHQRVARAARALRPIRRRERPGPRGFRARVREGQAAVSEVGMGHVVPAPPHGALGTFLVGWERPGPKSRIRANFFTTRGAKEPRPAGGAEGRAAGVPRRPPAPGPGPPRRATPPRAGGRRRVARV